MINLSGTTLKRHKNKALKWRKRTLCRTLMCVVFCSCEAPEVSIMFSVNNAVPSVSPVTCQTPNKKSRRRSRGSTNWSTPRGRWRRSWSESTSARGRRQTVRQQTVKQTESSREVESPQGYVMQRPDKIAVIVLSLITVWPSLFTAQTVFIMCCGRVESPSWNPCGIMMQGILSNRPLRPLTLE